jgi:tetratricopeptide (TPR) repeat protein
MMIEPADLAEKGKRAFREKKFDEAAEYFKKAEQGFTEGRSGLMAAEMKNNLSVALLQAGKPAQALEAALDTDKTFASAGDIKRQATALANQAAALEDLKRFDEALSKYETSAELFAQIHEDDMRSTVIKAIAGVKLKTGHITESAFKMIGAMDARKNPSVFERIIRFFTRLIIK